MKSRTSVIALALRLFVRDWRAGELRVLIAALIIAVGSVTTVSFFADRVGRDPVAFVRTLDRRAESRSGIDEDGVATAVRVAVEK